MIFPACPYFSEEDRKFILKEFDNILSGKGFLTDSTWNRKFEEEFAKYIGTKFALTTSNGTSALDLIYRALDLKGSEVIVPTNTFAATANALINAGGIPVFADIGDDLNIDADDVEKKITKNTKVIVVVHIGGFISEDIVALQNLCCKYDLLLIEDSAQAAGSKLGGNLAGNFGNASAFSFFSTKVITSLGEGGMVTTNDEELYNRMKIIRDHGKEKLGIYQNYHKVWGYNFRMTEVQALGGLSQLSHIEEFIKARENIAKVYDKELRYWKAFQESNSSRPNWYKWIGLCDEEKREELYLKAKENGVNMGGMVYEFPLHVLPAFAHYRRDDLPNAENLCSRMFCPPIHTQMTEEDAKKVCEVIKDIL